MSKHFADRLYDACGAVGAAACVGLDPVVRRLPPGLRDGDPLAGIETFCTGVIDAISGHIAMVKPQIACFEQFGSQGLAVFERVIRYASQRGMIVIGDAKRGDVGFTADHYAKAFLDGPFSVDAVTINCYFGPSGIQPFADLAAEHGKGVFVLVRTSNRGGDAIQSLVLKDGRTVAMAVADLVAEIGQHHLGACGYSSVGAVIGATHPDDAAALRGRMPRQIFLVPGVGAQGAQADDVQACFNPDGQGAVVTAARSVIYAFEQDDYEPDWPQAVAAAAERLRADVAAVSQMPA